MSTWWRTFQNSPMFANLALHAWAGLAVCLMIAGPLPRWAAIAIVLVWSMLKEFWFDMRYEIPPQQFGSIAGGGALQDFTGYVIGVALAIIYWLVVS